jgi:hypothetical protein
MNFLTIGVEEETRSVEKSVPEDGSGVERKVKQCQWRLKDLQVVASVYAWCFSDSKAFLALSDSF